MLQNIPIILEGYAANCFYQHHEDLKPYTEAFDILRKWYISDEKRAQVLEEWKNTIGLIFGKKCIVFSAGGV